jgi:hypothetical protein
MNWQKWILLVLTLSLVGVTAGVLARLSGHQRLGAPGVKTHPLPGGSTLQVDLPEQVLEYRSEFVEVDDVTRKTLPKDTSFGQRKYEAPDGFVTLLNVVLMGSDRTSLHKPQFCLEGQGWHIDQTASANTSVTMEKPCYYSLPVVRLVATKEATIDGQRQLARGVYVYWFVADDALSSSVLGFHRMWLMAKKLLTTGVLQRWAYVSCFSVCVPGQEEATFERMKRFIAASTPEFQLTPRPTAGVGAPSP